MPEVNSGALSAQKLDSQACVHIAFSCRRSAWGASSRSNPWNVFSKVLRRLLQEAAMFT